VGKLKSGRLILHPPGAWTAHSTASAGGWCDARARQIVVDAAAPAVRRIAWRVQCLPAEVLRIGTSHVLSRGNGNRGVRCS
jgi:hypothetical protein